MIRLAGKKIQTFFQRILPTSLEWETNYSQARIKLFLVVFLIAAGGVVLGFGIQDLLNGAYNAALPALAAVTGCFLGLFFINRPAKKALIYRTVFVLLLVLFGEAAWNGGDQGSMALWALILPPTFFFLSGRIEGLLWTLGSLALIAWIMLDPWKLLNSNQYTEGFLLRFFLCFVIISAIACASELSRYWYQTEMEEQHRKLLEEKVFLKNSISLRIQVEEALRKSQSLYELLTRNMKDVIWTTDLDFRLTYVSPGIRLLQGFTPEELADKSIESMMIADSLNNAVSVLTRLAERKSTQSVALETEMLHKNGGSVWVETVASLYLDDNGNPAGFIGSSRDISDRKGAEAALRKSEERFREFVEKAPVGMFTVDLHGKFTYMNKKVLQMTGYRSADMLGRQFYQIVHPEDLPKIIRAMEDAASGVRTTPYLQARIRDSVGKIMWIVVTSEMLMGYSQDDKRTPIGFQCFVEDVTERKFAEMEKLRLERQLRQSHKMEAIGTLAGGIAHDFNNILSPIIGYTEMLRDTLKGDKAAVRDLSEVLKAARRAKELVSQILTFSRKSEEKPQLVALAPIVSDVLNLIRATLPATIQIHKDIDLSCGSVMADSTQMHQVVMNLCTNAYQVMRQTGGVLEVTLKETQLKEKDLSPASSIQPGRYAWLSVSDTGEGMPPEIQERIFEPYFTTKPIGEGTGMGLAVAHAIVTKHRGEIRVQSSPGRGTVFDVFIPVMESQTRDVPFIPSALMQKGDERIMLVEDEEAILDMTHRMLKKLGYKVTPFQSSQEALEAFKDAPRAHDLLLTDMTMPHMTGFELAVKIREIRSDMPILLCTGFSDQISDERIRDFGPTEFLIKPISMHVMASSLRKVLDS
ncbi:PAS/PAC sensor hybrid histidine kinase [Desulfatibacillum aliphaticivorans]|uniref:histidine kinase n=1 Tax=Desulfatibacillum aliphaticivorans TaxID=218208 RepID=B8FG61_DESAL|nr:PAS/PAC sensor hybrid histidine kinase [Desulfatibacillum aliphaticivorans]